MKKDPKKEKKRLTNGDPVKPSVKQEPIVGSKKRGFVYDSYQDMNSFKQKPIAYTFLQALADDLIDWSLKDTSLRIESFYMDEGIRQTDYYRFLERCSELKDAHDVALARIAVRRDTGALTKKYDSSWAARTQAAWDPEYRKARKFEAELTKDAQENQAKIVVMEIMPNSIEVKDKKEDE